MTMSHEAGLARFFWHPDTLLPSSLCIEVAISENDVARQVTVFGVILLQLLKKVADGNLRAKRLLDRCKALADFRPEIYVITADEQKQTADEYERRLRR